MYLKELDLQGFKSFPEKVKLEFNKGITAVVGPNGSGKSNISDAVRWVLGEQRPKNLRGGKMEDVIFAGTANRRPVGFAEVSMTVDNSDRQIDAEYSEIKITRRVYRSGESNYYINSTECRLKDIYELFMDTGIGRDGYSIIGQGKIDEILSNKSEDRRQLFEEAAGIVKYKNRRTEAEHKLEREQANLVRITDILSEIEDKVEPLEKQAEKAKIYLELYTQLKDADIRLFCINGKKLEKDIRELEDLIHDTTRNIEDNEENLEKLRQQEENVKTGVEELSDRMEQINRDVALLTGEIEKNEGICRLTDEQIKNLKDSEIRLDGEQESRRAKIAENTALIEEGRKALDEVLKNIENMKSLLEEKETTLSAMLEKDSEREKIVEDCKSEMIEKIRQSADVRSSCERMGAMIEQFNGRLEQTEREKADTEAKIRDRGISIKSLEAGAENSRDTVEELKKETAALEVKKNNAIRVVNAIRDGLEQKKRELSEKQSRLRVLTDMEKEHDGYYKSVKAVLQLKDSGKAEFKGVRGAVAELLKSDEKYELAIETALGGSMQSIVVENERDAKSAVQYLKNSRLGRATFLPMSTIRGRNLGNDKDRLLNEKGVIAAAVDLVKFDREYTDIAESLLGRIIVIDTMDNAIAFAAKFRQSYKLVTLEGELFMPGGAITGGSTGRKNGGVFGRKREIEELKTGTEALYSACEGLKEEIDKNTASINSITEKIEDNKEESRAAEIDFITAGRELEQAKKGIAELEEKLRLIGIEQKQLGEQIEVSEKDKNSSAEKMVCIEREIAELQTKLNQFREIDESGKSGRESAANEITALKVDISSLNENKKSRLENIERLENENKLLAEQIENADRQKESILNETLDRKKAAEDSAVLTEKSRNEKAEKEKELAETTEKRKAENEKLADCETKLNDCRETLLNYKNELVRLETKSEKLSEEKRRLNDDMWETYEITYPEALKYPEGDEPAAELSKKARGLKAEIKSLGAVNVNAVDEYRELKERFEFLSAQKNDIIEAEEKLKDIIKDLAGLMEKQFREKLEIISENFNEVFREMFGGGRAYLRLADEGDVLGSGIDIIAQPPGKNLQNMMLLSGGERALTAIAILFSILKMKPSPFCILDEIEAALDDANVQRFGDYLQRFSKGTQFIVITHRKGTMESADVLYGVTMQEHGVSKIVSVKFDEALV